MTTYTVVADPHLGLKRKNGATVDSMRRYRAAQTNALPKYDGNPLLIVGDLFADFDAGHEALADAYLWLSQWKGHVTLLQGNHDWAKDRSKMSSLDLLGMVMPQLNIITEPTLEGDIAFVPHVSCQAEFSSVLEEAAAEAKYLVTHANYENPFAAEQDHSLNMTFEQCSKFKQVISGHEHIPRQVGNVWMLGSLLPCNIAEAEANHFIYEWEPGQEPVAFPSWHKDIDSDYEIQDWRNLCMSRAQFVRIVGEATAEEAALVIQEIAKFRAQHQAFIISNSVKVDDLILGDIEEATESLEGFDPLKVLMEILSEKTRKRLEVVAASYRPS